MDKIVVNKADLLKVVTENREQHRAIFEEALVGFRAKVVERLDEMIARAKANKKIEMYIGLVQPEDHTKDYDLVIGMLGMDVGDTVELSAREYAQYVTDDWGWRERFLTTNAYYSGTAQRMSDEAGYGSDARV
jgi:hypothetical protein